MKTARAWRLIVPLVATSALIFGGLAPDAAAVSPSAGAAANAAASTLPLSITTDNGDGTFNNPVMYSDVPDVDVAYDGHYYYMVSTTMYFAPGIPIMRSTDMVHWSIVDYTSPILDDTDALALRNGKNAYSKGSWAASIRFHNGTYYISAASQTTNETYIYTTKSIENGPWTRSVLAGYNHDQSLMFDGDSLYLVYGSGQIDLRPLTENGDGTVSYGGAASVLVNNANINNGTGLGAEGHHAYKIGDYYYDFMIEWPSGGIRQEITWRSKTLTPQSQGGDWEGQVVFSQRATVQGQAGDGAAQGGVVQGADGKWYAMLFQDQGSLGRSPQLASVTWSADGWPQYTLTQKTAIPTGGGAATPTDIVASDEFDNSATKAGYWNATNYSDLTTQPEDAYNGSNLPLQWQWNHNPDNRYWSLTDNPGHLRLTTGSLSTNFLDARNTLTQRSYGPTSSGVVALDVSHMKDGDSAGLGGLQEQYGSVGVTMSGGTKNIVMQTADTTGKLNYTSPAVPLTASTVYLKEDFNFQTGANTIKFYYSLNGTAWTPIGTTAPTSYSLTLFTGYRFALYNYATATTGGYVDFDYFHVGDQIGQGVVTPINPCVQNSAQVIDNGGFENGTLSPWVGNDGSTVTVSTTDLASGNYAVSSTKRTTTGSGPAQSVANELTAGATYTVSAKVLYKTGPATKQFNLTVLDSSYKGAAMASVVATKGQWANISGTYTVPTSSSSLNLTTAKVFVETPYVATPDATNDLMDFWADDISMIGTSAATFDGGILTNGGFETGAATPWTGNGTGQLAVTNSDKADGACSVYTTGRTKTGDGPLQSIPGLATAGSTYAVSAKVKYTTGPASHQFNLTIQDKTKAYIMASATVTQGAWTTISGNYTIPATGFDPSTAKVFVETVYTGTPDATNDLMDFFTDSVSMKLVSAGHPAGTALPAKAVGNSNPLMDYQYGADPYAMVYNGRVYEYMTGDGSYVDANGNVVQDYEYDTSGNIKDNSYSKIQTIDVISSSDMVNWTNNGAIKVAGPKGAATWASNSWAPTATHKTINGKEKFFLYFANSAGGIGVLTSDSPVGPWVDPIGKPLVSTSTPGTSGVVWMFDPAVLIDDDGEGYLYFGGGVPSTNGTSSAAQTDHPQTARVIQLGADMISTVGSAATIDSPAMFEDSGINKIGDTYYYSYCTNFSHSATIDGNSIPTGAIGYMTSSSPMGPFTYKGTFLNNPGSFFGAGGNNHHAMFQFNGQLYVTYHAQTVQTALVKGGSLDKEHGYRSTQIDKVTINPDGSIAPVTGTYAGIAQTTAVDPYKRVEGETIGWDSGVQDAYKASSGIRVGPIGTDNSGGEKLTNINNGEWTALGGVDFTSENATGATSFTGHVAGKAGGTIGIYLDSPDTTKTANLVGTLTIPAGTGSTWTDQTATLTKTVTGTHNVFFVYSGTGTNELFDVDYEQFTPAAAADTTAPTVTATTNPATADGSNGWFVSPVTVTLAAKDDSSGVKSVEYQLNGGVWQSYSAPFTLPEGITTVGYRATDNAGNVSAVAALPVRDDQSAPGLTVTYDDQGGKTTSPVPVVIAATDTGSGVASVEYQLDGGNWTSGSAVTVTGAGVHALAVKAVDIAGNSTGKSVIITIAPFVSQTLTSAVAPSNGWYTGTVSVGLSTTTTGTKIQYQTDDGAWKNYSSAVSVAAEGTHVITTRLLKSSVVVDGSTDSFSFKIDKTDPVASSGMNPTTRKGTPRNPVVAVFTASDATSGVAKIEYNLNGGSWTAVDPGTPVAFSTVGSYVVGYRATDHAGNVSATKSYTVTIATDPSTSVKVSPAKAAAGTYITVTVDGFHRYATVDISLGTTGLISVLTDENGTGKVTVQVPAGTAAGSTTLTASEEGSDLTGTAPLKIT